MSTRLLKDVFEPLPLGTILPRGWLERQLQIQAQGLTGHLDEFWPDIAQSQWIGGSAEGWERAPYWLDGLLPLAYLLQDAQLQKKVEYWMEYILSHQQEDGWLGPIHDSTYGYEYDPWPAFVLLKVFSQYYEVSQDIRVLSAMERFLIKLRNVLAERPLQSWAQMRSEELVLSLFWLYRRTEQEWLLDFAQEVQRQGFDWQALYAQFPYTQRQDVWLFQNHVVNHAMALKQPALWYQLSHDEADRQDVLKMMQTLDSHHGQVTGVFSGDEVLAGKNPSQGTELCAVVEYMFALEKLLSMLGEVSFGDRLERIAFNALPAACKPDFWAHQYDQQVNQVICQVAQDRLYTTNGADANIFGLEPNFGCCTANMHQGWPKLASHLWMRTDEGLAAVVYAPCLLKTEVAGTVVQIEVQTSYPFEETIQIIVQAREETRFPLLLRLPGWCHEATVAIGENAAQRAEAGTFYRVEYEGSIPLTISLRLSMPCTTQTRYNNSVSIERGPLIYSLKINEQWRQIRGTVPHADWEVHPLSPWNYALEMDREYLEHSCRVEEGLVGEMPFAPDQAPIRLYMRGRRVPSWTIEHAAAGPIPASPVVSSEPLEELTLIPYGCTNLRVTEFPTLG